MNSDYVQHSLLMDFEVSVDEEDPGTGEVEEEEEEEEEESETEDDFDDESEGEDNGDIGEYDPDAAPADTGEAPMEPEPAAVRMPLPYIHEPPPRLDEHFRNDGDAPDEEHPERLLNIDW